MKKFIITFLITSILLSSLVGCGNTVKNTNSTKDEYSITDDNTVHSNDTNTNDSKTTSAIYAYEAESKLDGNAIIRSDCELLLKTDGTIVGRGDSSFGALGNGERTNSGNWVTVSGLSSIKKIYAASGVGDYSKPLYDFCYALTENGDLYRWAGNILEPEIFMQGVKDFYYCVGGNFLITYEDGHQEAIVNYWNHQKAIIDITEMVYNSEILYSGGETFIIKDNSSRMCYYIEMNIELGEILDERHYIYKGSYAETNRYEIGDNVASVFGACYDDYDKSYGFDMISESGEHAIVCKKNNTIVFKQEWDGRGYKYYKRIPEGGGQESAIALLGNTVYTSGNNEYGQLGDGTFDEYYDGWLEVDEFDCIELMTETSEIWGQYCVALDDAGNIWCWGGKFSSTPIIEVPSN